MLEPPKSAPDYAEQKARLEKELKEGNGVTSWGSSHAAVDIMKSPVVTGKTETTPDPKDKK